MPRLKASEIKAQRPRVPEWRRRGATLVRRFEFEDFVAAIRFVNGVARIAERAGHHPEILVCWNRVTLTLTTHDEGGLTAKDFDLAARLDRVTARRGARP